MKAPDTTATIEALRPLTDDAIIADPKNPDRAGLVLKGCVLWTSLGHSQLLDPHLSAPLIRREDRRRASLATSPLGTYAARVERKLAAGNGVASPDFEAPAFLPDADLAHEEPEPDSLPEANPALFDAESSVKVLGADDIPDMPEPAWLEHVRGSAREHPLLEEVDPWLQ